MKRLYLVACILLLYYNLSAQQSDIGKLASPLPFREVSGLVKDEKDEPIPGVIVALLSSKDTLKTVTDENGVFIFKKVQMATFFITVSGIGVDETIRKYLNNDLAKKIVLDPIQTKPQINILKEVKINGKPTISYKKDTVEYLARDYRLRENATVDELLKKMEGMAIGSDGSLTYQGQRVAKAKLNGKEFAGGSVAQTIQSLPADIVGKVQIIEDYGEMAAKTGIVTETPKKVLNLTTKTDRSIGTYGSLTTQAGNDERYNVKLSVLHINANRQLAFIGNQFNIVTGIANDDSGFGSTGPGNTRSSVPSVSYSDQWNEKVKVEVSYTYNFYNTIALKRSFGQYYSFGQNDSIKNASSFKRQSKTQSSSRSQNLISKIDWDIDKFNTLEVIPTVKRTDLNDHTQFLSDQLNNFTTGFEHPVVNENVNNTNASNAYGLRVHYWHVFKKPRRLFAFGFRMNNTTGKGSGDVSTDYNYFNDSTQNRSIKDSTAHLLTQRVINSGNYNFTLNYAEPVGAHSRLDFTSLVDKTLNNAKALSDTLYLDSLTHQTVERRLSRLDNIFNYSFTETRITLNYRYDGSKLLFSAGASAVPTFLTGTKVNNNTGQNISTPAHDDFRIIPVFQLSYALSQTERVSTGYSGTNLIPEFQEIQPFIDRSDPNNIIVGNPRLKPEFADSVYINYNKYMPNSKVTLGFNLSITNYRNRIVTNAIQRAELISVGPDKYKTITEINFVNLDGANSTIGNYSIAKQFEDNKYSILLNGGVSYGRNVAMSNNALYHTNTWKQNDRVGLFIAPNEWLNFNPYFAYNITRTFTRLPGVGSTSFQITSLGFDGRMYFLKSWNINWTTSKSLVAGLGNLDTDPLVINAGFEKSFLQRKNLVLSFNVYDLLHQNNFLQQVVSAQGVTNTLSNSLSRYFLVGFHLILQKWSGTPERNGERLHRRGDGSFIYK